jgi:hypothetical protein
MIGAPKLGLEGFLTRCWSNRPRKMIYRMSKQTQMLYHTPFPHCTKKHKYRFIRPFAAISTRSDISAAFVFIVSSITPFASPFALRPSLFTVAAANTDMDSVQEVTRVAGLRKNILQEYSIVNSQDS